MQSYDDDDDDDGVDCRVYSMCALVLHLVCSFASHGIDAVLPRPHQWWCWLAVVCRGTLARHHLWLPSFLLVIGPPATQSGSPPITGRRGTNRLVGRAQIVLDARNHNIMSVLQGVCEVDPPFLICRLL